MTIELDESKEEKRDLVIRIPRQSFSEFMASLLGTRRTIFKPFRSKIFAADKTRILNIISVISDRVKQNEHNLVSFSADIYFSDGTIKTVSDFESFKYFDDFSSTETLGVYLKMGYLVSFAHGGTPEKQDIAVKIFSDAQVFDISKHRDREDVASWREWLDSILYQSSSLVEISIDYTDLTFGEDVSRHIAAQIDRMCEKTRVTDRFISAIVRAIPKLYALTVLAVFSFHGLVRVLNREQKYIDTLKEDAVRFTAIKDKLDYGSFNEKFVIIFKYLPKRKTLEDIFLDGAPGWLYTNINTILICIIIYFILEVIISRYIVLSTKSYVLLNKYTTDVFKAESKSVNVYRWSVFLSLVIGIVASLIANMIGSLHIW